MNLETIARLSGVSRSTVSRVINDSPNVRAEVRERVIKVLQETNFQPNLAARGLAAGKTKILGLVVPQGFSQIFIDPYFPLLIQGVSSACNAHEYALMLWLEEPKSAQRMIRQILHSGMIDGVIITSSHRSDPVTQALLARSFPFVVVGRVAEDLPASYVDIDNVSSARRAVEHLLGLGRRRIVTIAGPLNMVAAVDRLQGYYAALSAARIEPPPEWVDYGDYTQEGGFEAMQRLLACQPDAVFASSDAMAVGAARALQAAGITVGREVALIGFDDVPFASHMQPPLTTIRQPIEALGQFAAEMLIRQLRGDRTSTPAHQLLATELIVRQSCGAYSSL
jgi:LacI family transcriptional regulator